MAGGAEKTGGKGKRLDPELRRQMEEAARAGTDVQAVFVMRSPEAEPVEPEAAEAMAHELISRAQQQTGHKPSDVNVFRNLSSFVLQGPPALVRQLADDDRIESARPNRRPGSMRIEPPPRKRRR